MKKFINSIALAALASSCYNSSSEEIFLPEETVVFQEGSLPSGVAAGSKYYFTRIQVETGLDLNSNSFRLTINRNRQPVLVWNSRAVGLWTHERAADGNLAALVGIVNDAPCPQLVCRAGIQQDDILSIRIDVCNAERCIEGTERQMRVNILPL